MNDFLLLTFIRGKTSLINKKVNSIYLLISLIRQINFNLIIMNLLKILTFIDLSIYKKIKDNIENPANRKKKSTFSLLFLRFYARVCIYSLKIEITNENIFLIFFPFSNFRI